MGTSWESNKSRRLEQRKEKSTEILKNVRWYKHILEVEQKIFKSQQFSLIIATDENQNVSNLIQIKDTCFYFFNQMMKIDILLRFCQQKIRYCNKIYFHILSEKFWKILQVTRSSTPKFIAKYSTIYLTGKMLQEIAALVTFLSRMCVPKDEFGN